MARQVGVWVAVVFLVMSAFAHSLFGWSVMAGELAKTNVPHDIAVGLAVSWRLGGAAQLIFASILAWFAWSRRTGAPAPSTPIRLLGAGYAIYGAWAFIAGELEPFFLVAFVAPGLLILWAAG